MVYIIGCVYFVSVMQSFVAIESVIFSKAAERNWGTELIFHLREGHSPVFSNLKRGCMDILASALCNLLETSFFLRVGN